MKEGSWMKETRTAGVVNKRVQRRTEQKLDNQNEESIGF